MKRILVISPHPDDEIIGCGGVLDQFKKKNQLSWIIITKMTSKSGYSQNKILKREKEIKTIKKKLSFKRFFNLGFDTKQLNKGNLSLLIEKLSKIIKKIKPQIIFVPYLHDSHSDHFFTAYAINHLLKSFRYPFLETCYYYETLSETNLSFAKKNKFVPNVYFDITKNLSNKIKLVKTYKSEIKKHPFPRSIEAIKALATLRGAEAGYKYSESFQLIFQKKKNLIKKNENINFNKFKSGFWITKKSLYKT